MADTKISALTALTGANLAKLDEWPLVDKSDTTMNASGTDKKMTSEEFANAFGVGQYQPKISGGAEQWVMPGVIVSGTGTGTTNEIDRLQYEPMIIDQYCQLDALGFGCSTLHASAMVRIGLYKADEDWQPTDLVVDAGELAITSTGIKSVGSLATALAPGRYLKVRNCSASSGAIYLYKSYPVSGIWFSAATLTNFVQKAQVSTSTYAAFASTGVAWTTAVIGSAAGFDSGIFCQLS